MKKFSVEKFEKVWKILEKCGKVCKSVEKFEKSGKVWKSLKKCGKVWKSMEKIEKS